MSYIPSVNIEHGISNDFQYIVTPNTKNVWGNIVSSFHAGIHPLTIIGTYRTAKSSFIATLPRAHLFWWRTTMSLAQETSSS